MNLTPQQEAVFNCLQQVDPNTLWGLSIHKVLKEVDGERLDTLVEQLQSQNRDNPAIMREILSAPCYDTVVNYQR